MNPLVGRLHFGQARSRNELIQSSAVMQKQSIGIKITLFYDFGIVKQDQYPYQYSPTCTHPCSVLLLSSRDSAYYGRVGCAVNPKNSQLINNSNRQFFRLQ